MFEMLAVGISVNTAAKAGQLSNVLAKMSSKSGLRCRYLNILDSTTSHAQSVSVSTDWRAVLIVHRSAAVAAVADTIGIVADTKTIDNKRLLTRMITPPGTL
ncbi:hypothetical protein [Ruegeria sp. R8_1]|uniref:hypothetical protein n=1 Tax=Ruegeria sp. R8_1 TaxID=2821109 RepID=UPI001AD9E553|nr:hypothetical protein [Ruegeria sp. R8_1]MBO9413425.1 hypothetical protein [Ruegeria sp. R8_1]